MRATCSATHGALSASNPRAARRPCSGAPQPALDRRRPARIDPPAGDRCSPVASGTCSRVRERCGRTRARATPSASDQPSEGPSTWTVSHRRDSKSATTVAWPWVAASCRRVSAANSRPRAPATSSWTAVAAKPASPIVMAGDSTMKRQPSRRRPRPPIVPHLSSQQRQRERVSQTHITELARGHRGAAQMPVADRALKSSVRCALAGQSVRPLGRQRRARSTSRLAAVRRRRARTADVRLFGLAAESAAKGSCGVGRGGTEAFRRLVGRSRPVIPRAWGTTRRPHKGRQRRREGSTSSCRQPASRTHLVP